MNRSKLVLLFVALAAILSLPIVAGAAPARSGTLNAGSPVYEWMGAKKTANTAVTYAYAPAGPCNEPLNYCDDTLLKMEVPEGAKGTSLTVEIPATGANDFDVYVYRSDANGAVQPNSGVGLSNEEAPSAEKVVIPDPTGFYLVRVVYFDVTDAAYPGKATLKGLAAPAQPAPTAEPTPPPNPEPGSGGGGGGGSQEPVKPPPSTQPQPQPQPAPAQPSGTLSAKVAVARTRIGAARKKGLSVKVTCSRDCQGTLALQVDKRTAKKLRLGKKATTIGKANVSLAQQGTKAFKVKFTRKAAKALRQAKRLKLTAVATLTDPKQSQKATARQTVTLKK